MRQEVMQTRFGREHVVMMEACEFPQAISRWGHEFRSSQDKWSGAIGFSQKIVTGDNDMVEESDRFMSEIEDQVPMSRGWRNVDDVVGAVPNVPAFLAGHPQHMRRRERVSRDSAPLRLYLDLTSQAKVDARDVHRRGVVMLALVRLLVEHRAVELWAGITQDVGRSSNPEAGTVCWHVDTAPLDLARAAYHVGATAMSRHFGYGVNRAANRAGGGWAFHNASLQRSSGEERARQMFGGDVLHVPSIMKHDPMLQNPVAWLRRVISKYVQPEEE